MNTGSENFFVSYEEWRDAMANICKIPLTPDYCAERVRALQDPEDSSTGQFLELYGPAYRDRVIGWFERAGSGN